MQTQVKKRKNYNKTVLITKWADDTPMFTIHVVPHKILNTLT